MTLKQSIDEIKTHIQRIDEEIDDLETKGRKSSGPRARKSALIVKTLLHTLRSDISEYQKGLPVKKREKDLKK